MNKHIFGVVIFVVVGMLIAFGTAVIAMPDAGMKIGVAAGIAGEVTAVSAAGETRILKGGDPLFQGDTVATGAESKMQILLLDQTVFTIGAESSIQLDEFVYDPETSEGRVNANIIRGAFRFISGKVAHKKPENMSVDLPVGNIGVRGTFVAGQSQGERSLVVLLGGPNGQGSGAIHVSNNVNGQPVGVNINQGGYGTVIEGANMPPLLPFPVPPQDLMNLASALGQQAAQGAAQQGAAQTLGGGDVPGGTQPPPDMSGILNVLTTVDDLTQTSQTAAQDAADTAALSSGQSTNDTHQQEAGYNR